MEIVNKKKPSCRFDEIEEGQCFITCVNPESIYMRMKVVNSEYIFVAVDLTTGQLYAFDQDIFVTPIKAKVEID